MDTIIKVNRLKSGWHKPRSKVKKTDFEDEFKAYLNVAIDFFIVLNKQRKIVRVYQECQDILGWKSHQVKGKYLDQFIDNKDIQKIIYIREKLETSDGIKKGVQLCRTKDNESRWLEWRAKYITDSEEIFVALRDITKEMELDRERRAYKEALQVEVLKNEFMANLSHELRTPLNIIYTMLQLAEDEIQEVERDKQLDKYRTVFRKNTFRLIRILNNVLDVTKIDAGSYALNLVNCNIINVIEETTLSVVQYIKNKDLEIIFDTEEEEIIMACDIEKIERIMLNLLSNAVKYTPSGGSIFVNLKKESNNLIIEVKDTGIGIPKNKQEIIFDKFTQVEKLFTRRCEGSGMGLALVKSFVQMMDGKVSVESEEAIGSKFTVVLPIIRMNNNQLFTYDNEHQRVLRCNVEFSDIYDI